MEGTCNECVFPLTKEETESICPTDTSLTYAAGRGKLSCVKELIAAGADVNTACECHGNSALMTATQGGHPFCLIELIRAGAAVNHQSKTGRTALMFISGSECLEELMQAGADVNIKNDYQHTALMYAAQKGSIEIVKMLIDVGADVNTTCECHGNGALLSAVMGGHVDCLSKLIAAGADVNLSNKKGRTCLTFVRDGQCCNELISAGANVNIKDAEGGTSLLYALLNGNVDILEMLIDAGADVNIQNKFKGKDQIILMSKALAGNLESLQQLIDSGSLAAAVEQEHLNFPKELVKAEDDVNAKYIHQRASNEYIPQSTEDHKKTYCQTENITGMEGTCNKCIFPLNREESPGTCPTDTSLVYAAS